MAEETRKHILQAAITLFAQNGYNRTSVSDIVKRAGVTKPVLYYYFGSKDGLYQEIFRFCMNGFEEFFAKTFEGVETLEVFVPKFVRFDLEMFVSYREIISVLFSEFYSLRMHLPEEVMRGLMDRHSGLLKSALLRCCGGREPEDVDCVINIMQGMLGCYEAEVMKFGTVLSEEFLGRLDVIMLKMVKAALGADVKSRIRKRKSSDED